MFCPLRMVDSLFDRFLYDPEFENTQFTVQIQYIEICKLNFHFPLKTHNILRQRENSRPFKHQQPRFESTTA